MSDHMDGSITNSGSNIALEALAQSKTCDSPCCQHGDGCRCDECLCQVLTDIRHEYRTPYDEEEKNHRPEDWCMTESSVLSTEVTDDDVAHPTTTSPRNSDTNGATSPINIVSSSLHPSDQRHPLSHGNLHSHDGKPSYEDMANHKLRHYMSSLRSNVTIPESIGSSNPEIEHPEREFNSSLPPLSDCDCELMFAFESNENSRCNSNELPTDTLSSQGHRSSSGNASVAVRNVGDQFDSSSIATRSQNGTWISLCYHPLRLTPVPHRAARCA